jgi:hypothetical protein
MAYVIDPIRAYLFPQISLIYADSAGNIVFSIQLLTTHYSLLTTHYSLLTTHYSLLTTH